MRADGLSFDPADPLALATTNDPAGHEPKRANQCLRDYCLLGPQRSLERLWGVYEDAKVKNPLYKIPIKGRASLATYSMRYAWKERAHLYDEITQKNRQKELDQFWLNARTEIPLRDYTQSQKLRELIDKTMAVLENFVEEHEEVDQKTGKTTVYKKADTRTMIDALKLASELQRKSAGLDNKTPIQGNIDLNKLPTEYLDRIINGEPLEVVWNDYRNGTNSGTIPGPSESSSPSN